ncbi:MAG: DUF4974 domain-containing protein, partial [Bacteroidota bacterium]
LTEAIGEGRLGVGGSGKLKEVVVDGKAESSWRVGELHLKDATLREALPRIESLYNVEIEAPEAVMNERITSTVYKKDMGGFLEVCKLLLKCDVEEKEAGKLILTKRPM